MNVELKRAKSQIRINPEEKDRERCDQISCYCISDCSSPFEENVERAIIEHQLASTLPRFLSIDTAAVLRCNIAEEWLRRVEVRVASKKRT